MTDTAAALLQAVIADPADDGLRLVYADHLEEQGQYERAEFVRVQVELAKGRPEDTLVRGSSAWRKAHGTRLIEETEAALARSETREQALRRRERELLEACWVDWIPLRVTDGFHYVGCPNLWRGEVDRGGNGSCFTFRRGLVASVACTLAVWCGGDCGCRVRHVDPIFRDPRPDCPACRGEGTLPGHGPALVRQCPLEEVRLTDREPNDPGIALPYWFDASANPLGDAPHYLPQELFALLKGGNKQGTAMRHYPTLAAAHAALSEACIQWARAQEV